VAREWWGKRALISNLELDVLLAQEIDRQVGTSGDPEPSLETLRSLLHLLKGSASMAGHHDLTLLVTQLGQRLRLGQEGVAEQATNLLRGAAERLRLGLPPFDAQWPEPPPGLLPSEVASDQRGDYLNAMRDRLRELESVISSGFGDRNQLANACRSVHSMKAIAAAVGDDTMAWYCHHLEARLRYPKDQSDATTELFVELSNHRATLQRLLESPDDAFDMLRSLVRGHRARRTTPPSFERTESPLGRSALGTHTVRSSTLPPADDGETEVDATLRIPTATFEQFFDQIERIDIISDQLYSTLGEARRVSRVLRDLRAEFVDVKRALGPPKPWSNSVRTLERLARAVESVSELATTADMVEQGCRRSAELLRTEWHDTRRQLGRLRRTTLARVFARCEHAIHRYAEAEGKHVQVETQGGELSVERSLAERLMEPLLQIAKNAVSHGIEAPERRTELGKPDHGKLRLIAERQGEWLRFMVEDDGCGVDLERVRSRAVEQGVLSEAEAVGLGENELLNLLFVPGLTTRADAGIMAGRGVGLDLAQDVVRRLGGGIRFSVREQGGVRVTLELPQETGLVDVVWLDIDGLRPAVPVTFTGRLSANEADSHAIPLAGCLGLDVLKRPSLVLELAIPGLRPLGIAIDGLGDFEEVSVRPLPQVLANAGPYSGAALQGDGRLYLVLDAPLVAARAWKYAQ
jgi:two-component system, chemotaxis family, sensor kinase CheA